jgi:LuxR family maltose regulon positive regulatory protein
MTVTLLEDAHRRQRRPTSPRRAVHHHMPRAPRVRRPRLQAALGGPGGRPFAVLVAPAGYGKTPLLREWCADDPRPSAWLTIDRRHDDPLLLLRSIARTADEASAHAGDRDIVLVIDDVHRLRDPGAQETLAGVVRQPPGGMTIAFASRAELPLPVARLTAEGLVTELRAPELALTRAEAAEFYRAAGIRLDGESLDALLRHTEGWPAALALAAISLGRHAGEQSFARFDGRNRLAADYLRDEILEPLDDEARAFVVGTAPLDVLTAPLCDAALGQTGSAGMLARLQRSGFPFVALDRNGERLRHHRLVRAALHAELQRTAPGRERALHRRASVWHERAGEPEAALRHSLAIGDVGRAGAIVWDAAPACAERAANEMLEHWLSLFGQHVLAVQPRLALAAAAVQLAHGNGDMVEHWLRAASSAAEDARVAGGVAALRATLGRGGLAAMRDDAARGSALLAPDDPGQALCRLAAGVAAHLQGERELARTTLEDGARRAAVHAPHVHVHCLAQLALLALEADEREEAAGLMTRARAQVERLRLDRRPSSALVLAVAALIRAQRGRVEEAAQDLRAAGTLLEQLVDFAPWYAAEAEVVLARAALRLSDVNAARRHAATAARLTARIADATTLAAWVQAAEADIRTCREATRTVSCALTAAELKVLRFLPTHMTFRQIGELTCVTGNTVKTQANAVYRKLGVRSRSDAVVQARELGLIDA